jgi:tetratricopeptide (TPR) repeat protein
VKRTHYEVLGLGRGASPAEIRTAYRKLVLKNHPDRAKDKGAAERFIRIQEAYEVLKDPQRRGSYDRILEMRDRPAAKPKPQPQPQKPKPKPTQQRPTRAEYDRLYNLMNRSRYVEAENYARGLVERLPGEAVPYAALAELATMRGDMKAAAKLYAFAAQMDPRNPNYQRLHEQSLRSVPATTLSKRQAETSALGAVLGGLVTVVAASVYLLFSREAPLAPEFPPISSWTLGLVVMLLLCGLAMGASLTLGGLLVRFGAVQGGTVMRVPPTMLLGLIAAICFWVAAVFYFVVGASQNAFNASTSRLVAASAFVTVVLSMVAAAAGTVDPLQALLWGGNLVYVGSLMGWIVADGIRDQ